MQYTQKHTKGENLREVHKYDLISESKYDPQKQIILIVEDCLSLVNLFVEFFSYDFNVYYSFDGFEALQKIAKIPQPDIILSDVIMPGLEGIELCRLLKQDENFSSIPFIFYTNITDINYRLKCLKVGALDYIEKGTDIEELKLKIINIINHDKLYRKKILSGKSITRNRKIEVSCNIYKIKGAQKRIVYDILDNPDLSTEQLISICSQKYNSARTTIRTHIERISEKININPNTSSILIFFESILDRHK